MPVNCQRCGAQNADHSKFCLSCGNDLRPAGGPQPGTVGGYGPPPAGPGGFGPPPAGPGGFGPPPAGPGGFGPPPAPPGGFGPPPPSPGGYGGGFGPPPAGPGGFGGQAPQPGPPPAGFGPPPPAAGSASGTMPAAGGGDLGTYVEGLRIIATELRGIAASKTIFSAQVLTSPLAGIAAVAIRYGRSMHVLCAGGPFQQPIWPSRDFADRDRLLAATIGTRVGPEALIPWVLTYVLPGVFPDLGRDSQAQQAFVEAADAFGVGIDAGGLDAARRQGFPELRTNLARFLVVSEPKQSVAGIELRWGDRPFEMLYVPTPGVVARPAPWT